MGQNYCDIMPRARIVSQRRYPLPGNSFENTFQLQGLPKSSLASQK
jgi:hypothetical protein